MEVADLKKEIYSSLEELDDENILIEILELLKMTTETEAEDLSYESSPHFIAAIYKAKKQIENGEGYSYEEAMNIIKDRLWRTK